jgi:hypothetical protein
MSYDDKEVEDFLDRHADAIAGVLEAAKAEALKQELREALAKTINRQAGVRTRWEGQNDYERLRELVMETGIPVVLTTQR